MIWSLLLVMHFEIIYGKLNKKWIYCCIPRFAESLKCRESFCCNVCNHYINISVLYKSLTVNMLTSPPLRFKFFFTRLRERGRQDVKVIQADPFFMVSTLQIHVNVDLGMYQLTQRKLDGKYRFKSRLIVCFIFENLFCKW